MTPDPDQFDDELPEAMIAELRSVYGRDVRVPGEVDSRILNDARLGFAKRSRFRSRWMYSGAAAAAAVLIMGIVLSQLYPPKVQDTPANRVDAKMLMVVPATAATAEDVDHSGTVDILDAFVVAKLVETGKQIDEAYDVNGDGKVDQADVDRIAHAAVAVAPLPAGERRAQ